MGKKQHAKPESKTKLSANKQNELKILVDAVLEKSREKNPNEFQHYLEMNEIIQKIRKIESEMKPPFKHSRDSNAIEKFLQWCQEQGAVFPKIQLKKLAGSSDLGLVAKENLKKGEVFIEIPDSMIFSFSKIEKNLPEKFLECPLFAGMSHIRLAFALMVEKINPNSNFKPYLDVLPEKFRTVLFFSPNEMKELQGTTALSSATKQVLYIASQYAFLYKYLMTTSVESDVISKLRDAFSYDFYCWAVSSVMTRQNLLPQGEKCEMESVLIGLWDMANHSNGEINTVYNEETRRIESNCLKDFEAGENVFMSYGERTHEEFLIHNGFVFPDNTNKKFSIKLSLSKADELYDKRVEFLEKVGMKASGNFQIAPELSSETLAFVRVFNMTEDQLKTWSENAKELLNPDLKLDKPTEQKIFMFLFIRIQILMRAFPTTLEEDEILLVESKNQKTKTMLIQYRIIEKKALVEAAERIQAKIKSL